MRPRRSREGAAFEEEAEYWRTLVRDPEAVFDAEVRVDASLVAPRVSWGTNPAQSLPLTERVPDPGVLHRSRRASSRRTCAGLHGPDAGHTAVRDPDRRRVRRSCTNGRIEDLREAAAVLKGRHVAEGVDVLVVPGSEAVRRQAVEEGLDVVFAAAGVPLRHSGCSMCVGLNEDRLGPGVRAASTNNRNFEGRQGRGSRTHLVSPAVAAASAVAGRLATPSDRRPDMEPFVRHTGTAAPLRLANVDTDQIIPARFGVGVSRTGYGPALLYDKRADPGFVLNRPAHRDATILVAEENFGCGSSREMPASVEQPRSAARLEQLLAIPEYSSRRRPRGGGGDRARLPRDRGQGQWPR